VKNSKILQTVLTVIKMLSGGFDYFWFYGCKGEVWDANWTNAWTSQTLNVETGEWLPIAVWHIWNFGSLVGRCF
jgi:APA family basic amino acid/polyamine antiporter